VARVPQVQVVVVEKARHFVMLDAPHAFFATVEHFLAQAAAAP
jgi:pimeloyl-ACP methyl ester carboxylesterase